MAALWFDSNNHVSPSYMGTKKKEIIICPPTNITRTPRSLSQKAFRRNLNGGPLYFFFFFFVTLLISYSRHLFIVFYNHFYSFSITVGIILRNTGSFVSFVSDFEKLYETSHMSSNVLKVHLPDTVGIWGPI